jgi:hypothetical protein
MEKLIGCFARHQRNLYDAPEFVLFGVARFGRNLDLLVKTESKDRLLERLAKLKIPCKTLRCRPFDPAGAHGHGFAAWLVAHYGLDGSDPGRRRVRVGQRRPVGNNYTYHVWNRTAHRRLLFGPVEKGYDPGDDCFHLPAEARATACLCHHGKPLPSGCYHAK